MDAFGVVVEHGQGNSFVQLTNVCVVLEAKLAGLEQLADRLPIVAEIRQNILLLCRNY